LESFPIGRVYRQPKLEEGTDAFLQVRKIITMPEIGCRLLGKFAAVLLWRDQMLAVI
jgi:hypothetical protein